MSKSLDRGQTFSMPFEPWQLDALVRAHQGGFQPRMLYVRLDYLMRHAQRHCRTIFEAADFFCRGAAEQGMRVFGRRVNDDYLVLVVSD